MRRSAFICSFILTGLMSVSVAAAEAPAVIDDEAVAVPAAPEGVQAEVPAVSKVAPEKPAQAAKAPISPEDAKVDAVIDAARKEPDSAPIFLPPKKTASKKISAKKTAAKKAVVKAKPPAKPKIVVAKAAPAPTKPQGSTKPLSAYELGRYQYCGDDRDCMPAVNGCCDCANGGEDVAVNRGRYEAFRERFQCIEVSCGEKSRTPECLTGVVSCLNHKCRYFSEGALDDKF